MRDGLVEIFNAPGQRRSPSSRGRQSGAPQPSAAAVPLAMSYSVHCIPPAVPNCHRCFQAQHDFIKFRARAMSVTG